MEFNRQYYNYSVKHITLLSEKLYKAILRGNAKLLIKRMRWKAHLYNRVSTISNPLNYIFKGRKCPSQNKDLMQFEKDLLELIEAVYFKR